MKKRIIMVIILISAVTIFIFGMLIGKITERYRTIKVSKNEEIYDKEDFGETYLQYEFEDYDKVIYQFDNVYLLGDKIKKSKVKIFSEIIQKTNELDRDPKIIGISKNYIIVSVKKNFATAEREKIAVEITETVGEFGNKRFHACIEEKDIPITEKIHKIKKKKLINNPKKNKII